MRSTYSVDEAAELLHVSRKRIVALVDSGVLTAVKIGPRAIGLAKADVDALSWPPQDAA